MQLFVLTKVSRHARPNVGVQSGSDMPTSLKYAVGVLPLLQPMFCAAARVATARKVPGRSQARE